MIFAIAAVIGAVLIALDAVGNLRQGVAKTAFGTYTRHDRPGAFRLVCGVKLLMSVTLLVLASLLVSWNSA